MKIRICKLAFIFYTLSFFAIGCKKNNTALPPIINPPPSSAQKKYLALGDSYTIGQGVAASESFPLQTQTWLVANATNVSAPEIVAATGWTTYDLINAINGRNLPSNFSVVSLLIGVNDQYSRRDTTGYRNSFYNLLYTAIQLAGKKPERVFVASIPDYSVTPFARYSDTTTIRKQIDLFNKINKEVTLQNSCKYLDITPSSREARYDPSLLAADSLHFSGKEYHKWADRLGPMMKAVLD